MRMPLRFGRSSPPFSFNSLLEFTRELGVSDRAVWLAIVCCADGLFARTLSRPHGLNELIAQLLNRRDSLLGIFLERPRKDGTNRSRAHRQVRLAGQMFEQNLGDRLSLEWQTS